MNQIVLTGMVLSITPVGEYDRRVVILTKEQGKISAFARGARKPNSPLVGALNPFSFGEFTIYAGKASYTIQSAKITNYFAELREDMMGAYYGFYFLEFANYYTKEGNDEKEMLLLLYQTLRALSSPYIPDRLIRYVFELRALSINGEGPQVFECVSCGCKERPMVFSVKKGGLICKECGKDVIDGIRLDPSTIYTMQYIETSSIEKLYTFVVKENVLDELAWIMERYTGLYIDQKFKSLEILETLQNG